MMNYTIAESFTLPSEGKIYSKLISPQIKLRSMTTKEEMQRVSHSADKQFEGLCSIIDACMVDNPGISSYDMCLGDYQFLLYKLRTVTYGSEYNGAAICPYCGSTNECTFSIDDLPIKTYTDEVEKYHEFELPVSHDIVKIRMRTPRMLDMINSKVTEYKAKQASADSTLLYSIQMVIDTINGESPNPVYFTEWIKNLPMKDTNTIVNYSDKLDSMIGIDTKLFYKCDVCGSTFPSYLKQDQEFFRPNIKF